MKTRLALLTAATFFSSFLQAFSQDEDVLFVGIYSIDVPTDPRSVAMGESFVALYANPHAMFSNPAGLAAVSKTSIAYSRRTMNWIADEMKYSSVSASVPTSFLTVGLLYNRFFQGEFPVRTVTNPEGDGTKASLYDHTFGIGMAKEINGHFGVGLSVKTFNLVLSYSGPNAALFDNIESKTLPILFDFGFLYNNIFNKDDRSFQHQLSAGFSLQNIGSSLKQTQHASSTSPQARDITYNLPQFLRLGVSYGLIQYGAASNALEPLHLLVTLEYRNAFNAKAYPGKDYWGVGCEVRLYEIASVRIGGFNAPFTSIYGKEGKTAVRYGFGLNAPLYKIGENIPFSLSFDYAAIPLNDISFISPPKVMTLHTFSIRLQYENELF